MAVNEWGRPIIDAMVADHDHEPRRIRLLDFRGRDIPADYWACRICDAPFFRSADNTLIQPTSAAACGCVPDAEPCLAHRSEHHPVNA